MPKRLAEETAVGEVLAALPYTMASKISPAHNSSANNVPTQDPGFQRNSNKRLHLVESYQPAKDEAREGKLNQDQIQRQRQSTSDSSAIKSDSKGDELESSSSSPCNKKRKSVSPHESNGESKQRLFETEAHDTILNLARSATSKLMIQVYHRCFGKCVGLYHPSLLKSSDSECIECSSCHVMLSPRGFIGHTHGPTEVNVCHWGFNSYNWRSYIRLSRKQSMNNLDDDELLVQLERLKSKRDEASDRVTKFQETPDELKTKSSDRDNEIDRNNSETSCQQQSRAHISAAQLQAELDLRNNLINNLLAKPPTSRGPMEQLAQLSSAYSSHFDPTNISRYNITSPDKNPYLWNLPLDASTSSSSSAAAAAAVMAAAVASRKASLPSCMPISNGNGIGESNLYSTSLAYSHAALSLSSPSSSYLSPSLARSSSSNPSMTSMMSQLYGETARNFSHSATTPPGSTFPQLNTERVIKQDLFVSTGLASYLNSKGIHPKMAEDVVDHCLGLIHKARALF